MKRQGRERSRLGWLWQCALIFSLGLEGAGAANAQELPHELRIGFQSGAFLMFGHDATLPEEGSDDLKALRIGIRNKAEILSQLDRLNINERTAYPNIDNSAKYIAKRFALKVD